ncbi:ATP-binding protein [Sphingobacterium suaedae]|uniref:histidine kinase n=1 Tax=Sphingobacterium suaedae TaxID=1686402 RepID=A0ABW5KL41_9SPHI
MAATEILCEDEPIHLIGRIQQFGKLIVLSQDLHIVGISSNCQQWLSPSIEQFLGRSIFDFVKHCSPTDSVPVTELVQRYVESTETKEILETNFQDKFVTVRIYRQDDYIYLEFEEKNAVLPQILNFSSYSKRINRAGIELWEALCTNIREITKYDRVMIYQFLEDESGQVIAESKIPDASSYHGFRFPEFDIPKQARALYVKHHARQTSDIHAETYPILGKKQLEFDLSGCNLRALSPVHLQYLENAGARSSLSFSIIIEDKLWGLVACQHSQERHVDHMERTLCLFLTEFTANRHLTLVKERALEFSKRVAALELKIKENILLNNNVFQALSTTLPDLLELVEADGAAIVHPDRTVVFKTKLHSKLVNELHTYVSAITHKQAVYQNHQFNQEHGDAFGFSIPFAGFCRIDMDASQTFSVYVFRNEVVIEEEWAGRPEKIMRYDDTRQVYTPSPRQSFQAWKQSVYGTCIPWNSMEINALEQVRQVVRDSLLQRSDELTKLNEELIQLNNALDAYSYTVTHDLRNPLASIKLMAQFLQQKLGSEHPIVLKGTDNILDAVSNMEGMMNKILEFSRAKVYQYTPEWVDMSRILADIVQSCSHRYQVTPDSIQMGNPLPVFGEKTLLYQLFSNLVSNAVKYSSKAEKPQIRIDSFIEDGAVIYVIADNGIGIHPNELSQIYEVFKRLSNSVDFEGAGVGMAIVKRIVERLEAQIDVSSTLGVGTSIYLSFPNADIPEELLQLSSYSE